MPACYSILRNLFIKIQDHLLKSRGNSYIPEEILHQCGIILSQCALDWHHRSRRKVISSLLCGVMNAFCGREFT